MRDSAGPSTGWHGTHTAAVSLIGSSLIFINWGFLWEQSCNTVSEQQPSNTFPLSHIAAQLRAGATFVHVTASLASRDSASEAWYQTMLHCCWNPNYSSPVSNPAGVMKYRCDNIPHFGQFHHLCVCQSCQRVLGEEKNPCF